MALRVQRVSAQLVPVLSLSLRTSWSVEHVREVEVARPPCDAASITQLPGLSWKHSLRDFKRGETEQVCMIVPEADDTGQRSR
ncbi:hypothetical protein PC116_g21788 [Phytophthora cactorum]|nr:hypothetical protein PC116_g21788 [Phytophthora cactorum]